MKAKHLLNKECGANTQSTAECKALKVTVYRNLAQYYIRTEKPEKGLELLKRVLPLQLELEEEEIILPGTEFLYINMGDLSYKLKLFEETQVYCDYAVGLLSKQLDLKKGMIPDFQSAEYLRTQSDHKTSLVRARKFIAMSYVQFLYARALLALGKKTASVAYLERAVAISRQFLGPEDKIAASYTRKLQAVQDSLASQKKSSPPPLQTQLDRRKASAPDTLGKSRIAPALQNKDELEMILQRFQAGSSVNTKVQKRIASEQHLRRDSQSLLLSRADGSAQSHALDRDYSQKFGKLNPQQQLTTAAKHNDMQPSLHQRHSSQGSVSTLIPVIPSMRPPKDGQSKNRKRQLRSSLQIDSTIEQSELLVFDFSSPNASRLPSRSTVGGQNNKHSRKPVVAGFTTSLNNSRRPSTGSRPRSSLKIHSRPASPTNVLSQATSPSLTNKKTSAADPYFRSKEGHHRALSQLTDTDTHSINNSKPIDVLQLPTKSSLISMTEQSSSVARRNSEDVPSSKLTTSKEDTKSKKKLASFLASGAHPSTAATRPTKVLKSQTLYISSPPLTTSQLQTPGNKNPLRNEYPPTIIVSPTSNSQPKLARPQTAQPTIKSNITPHRNQLKLALENLRPESNHDLAVQEKPKSNDKRPSNSAIKQTSIPPSTTNPKYPRLPDALIEEFVLSVDDLDSIFNSYRPSDHIKQDLHPQTHLKSKVSYSRQQKNAKHKLSRGLQDFLKENFAKDAKAYDADTEPKGRLRGYSAPNEGEIHGVLSSADHPLRTPNFSEQDEQHTVIYSPLQLGQISELHQQLFKNETKTKESKLRDYIQEFRRKEIQCANFLQAYCRWWLIKKRATDKLRSEAAHEEAADTKLQNDRAQQEGGNLLSLQLQIPAITSSSPLIKQDFSSDQNFQPSGLMDLVDLGRAGTLVEQEQKEKIYSYRFPESFTAERKGWEFEHENDDLIHSMPSESRDSWGHQDNKSTDNLLDIQQDFAVTRSTSLPAKCLSFSSRQELIKSVLTQLGTFDVRFFANIYGLLGYWTLSYQGLEDSLTSYTFDFRLAFKDISYNFKLSVNYKSAQPYMFFLTIWPLVYEALIDSGKIPADTKEDNTNRDEGEDYRFLGVYYGSKSNWKTE